MYVPVCSTTNSRRVDISKHTHVYLIIYEFIYKYISICLCLRVKLDFTRIYRQNCDIKFISNIQRDVNNLQKKNWIQNVGCKGSGEWSGVGLLKCIYLIIIFIVPLVSILCCSWSMPGSVYVENWNMYYFCTVEDRYFKG